MKKIDIFEEIPQTYVTVKYKGKDREMRRFGECNLQDENGKVVRRLRPAEYLYVYRDGRKTFFSDSPSRISVKKSSKKGGENE